MFEVRWLKLIAEKPQNVETVCHGSLKWILKCGDRLSWIIETWIWAIGRFYFCTNTHTRNGSNCHTEYAWSICVEWNLTYLCLTLYHRFRCDWRTLPTEVDNIKAVKSLDRVYTLHWAIFVWWFFFILRTCKQNKHQDVTVYLITTLHPVARQLSERPCLEPCVSRQRDRS